MFFSSCTSPTYTQADLLAKEKASAREAVAIDSIKEKAEKQMELFNGVFSRYEREEIAREVPNLYAENAFLNDRIHSANGQKAIAEYFDGTFAKMHNSEFIIHSTHYGEKEAYIHWTMRIQLKQGQEYMEFLGMSQFRFNQEAKIIYHQDFWDFSELMGYFSGSAALVNFIKGRA